MATIGILRNASPIRNRRVRARMPIFLPERVIMKLVDQLENRIVRLEWNLAVLRGKARSEVMRELRHVRDYLNIVKKAV